MKFSIIVRLVALFSAIHLIDSAATYLDCKGVTELELFVYKSLLKPPERSVRFVEGSCSKYNPVCGNDLKTYDNMCSLRFKRKHCRQLRFLHSGSCVKPPAAYPDYEYDYSGDVRKILLQPISMDYYDDS